MKRGLTILTAALLAGALALPAMAQSTDNGANKEAPAAGAMANPGTMGSDSAVKPSDDSAAKAGSEEMKPEQKPADDSSAQQKKDEKSDTNTTSDAGSNPAGDSAPGHNVE